MLKVKKEETDVSFWSFHDLQSSQYRWLLKLLKVNVASSV